jgi:hypothetical protein
MRFAPATALFLAAILAPQGDAAPQFRNRERGALTREDSPRSREHAAAAPGAVGSDPFSSLERELISLKADLKLRADQAEAWAAFERDVRAAAETNRTQRRRILGLREANPPATASSLLGSLADDAQQEAQATAALREHLHALYGKLDAAQRAMLDRRVVQSQTEPLGR